MSKPEYILCAAIWYKELKLVKNDLPPLHLYPKDIYTGAVFCGYNHAKCMYTMYALTGIRSVRSQCGDYVQGFLTSKNRFVDRIEGLKIAQQNNQIIHNRKLSRLHSEDLYE